MYSKTCPIPVKNVRDKLIEMTPLSSLLSDCVGTVPKSIEKSQKETQSIILTHKYMTCLSTDTSIKSGGVKLVVWAQTSPLSEMMRSCKCFPRMSGISTDC